MLSKKEKEIIEDLKECENCHYKDKENCLCEVNYVYKRIILGIIEKQQKEIERLQNKDKEYMKIQNNNLEWQEKYNELKKKIENSKQFQVYISGMRSGKELLNKYINDSIPKNKIREKIKEIEENGYWDFLEKRDYEKTIKILKELLGDE